MLMLACVRTEKMQGEQSEGPKITTAVEHKTFSLLVFVEEDIQP
jgi:hypothetical protein